MEQGKHQQPAGIDGELSRPPSFSFDLLRRVVRAQDTPTSGSARKTISFKPL